MKSILFITITILIGCKTVQTSSSELSSYEYFKGINTINEIAGRITASILSDDAKTLTVALMDDGVNGPEILIYDLATSRVLHKLEVLNNNANTGHYLNQITSIATYDYYDDVWVAAAGFHGIFLWNKNSDGKFGLPCHLPVQKITVPDNLVFMRAGSELAFTTSQNKVLSINLDNLKCPANTLSEQNNRLTDISQNRAVTTDLYTSLSWNASVRALFATTAPKVQALFTKDAPAKPKQWEDVILKINDAADRQGAFLSHASNNSSDLVVLSRTPNKNNVFLRLWPNTLPKVQDKNPASPIQFKVNFPKANYSNKNHVAVISNNYNTVNSIAAISDRYFPHLAIKHTQDNKNLTADHSNGLSYIATWGSLDQSRCFVGVWQAWMLSTMLQNGQDIYLTNLSDKNVIIPCSPGVQNIFFSREDSEIKPRLLLLLNDGQLIEREL